MATIASHIGHWISRKPLEIKAWCQYGQKIPRRIEWPLWPMR